MKKNVFFILAFIMLLAACEHRTVDAIAEVNENMNLPFPLCLPETELKYGDEYDLIHGFGGYALCNEHLFISVSGWRDVLDDYHITEYRVRGGDYHVFGITIGGVLEDAIAFLEKRGYSRDDENNRMVHQKNEQMRITLFVDVNDIIIELWVTAIATNKDNVVF